MIAVQEICTSQDDSPVPHLRHLLASWKRLQSLKCHGQIEIDGHSLDIAAVVALARYDCKPIIARRNEVLEDIEKSVEALDEFLASGYCIYGVNTGFGGSASTRTADLQGLQGALMQLTQSGILTSADVAAGDERSDYLRNHSMPTEWTKASMLIRCNTNIRGHSALSLPVVDTIIELMRNDITPIIPVRGSISASGDLMPLSYVAGAIQGSSDIFVRKGPTCGPREITTAYEALETASIQPITLGPKEGLALINGTATSTAVASLALFEAQQLALLSQMLTALTSEALAANAEWAHPFVQEVHPHKGQIETAQNLRNFLKGSKLTYGLGQSRDRRKVGMAQERYALRSSPQWIGPQLEDLSLAAQQVSVELNSTSDNPVVDVPGKDIHCGANFQAAAVTSAMEKTRLCMQMLGKMLFSQMSEMINPDMSNGLPSNLAADDPSLSFCLKGLDINMAAYQSELAYLANPVNSHVQSAEMHNQAINSLALLSARYTMEAVEVLSLMSAACLYTCCQGVDLRVMHRTFLEKFERQYFDLVRSSLEEHLTATSAQILLPRLWEAVCADWVETTTLDAHERCQHAASTLTNVVSNSDIDCDPALQKLSMFTLRDMQQRIAHAMLEFYIDHREQFFQKPVTADYLGQGPRQLYEFVRSQLCVPMHRGLIEHPVTGRRNIIDGRPKRTIGSWVSIIYTALRDGRVHDEVMRCVERIGLPSIDGERALDSIGTLAFDDYVFHSGNDGDWHTWIGD